MGRIFIGGQGSSFAKVDLGNMALSTAAVLKSTTDYPGNSGLGAGYEAGYPFADFTSSGADEPVAMLDFAPGVYMPWAPTPNVVFFMTAADGSTSKAVRITPGTAGFDLNGAMTVVDRTTVCPPLAPLCGFPTAFSSHPLWWTQGPGGIRYDTVYLGTSGGHVLAINFGANTGAGITVAQLIAPSNFGTFTGSMGFQSPYPIVTVQMTVWPNTNGNGIVYFQVPPKTELSYCELTTNGTVKASRQCTTVVGSGTGIHSSLVPSDAGSGTALYGAFMGNVKPGTFGASATQLYLKKTPPMAAGAMSYFPTVEITTDLGTGGVISSATAGSKLSTHPRFYHVAANSSQGGEGWIAPLAFASGTGNNGYKPPLAPTPYGSGFPLVFCLKRAPQADLVTTLEAPFQSKDTTINPNDLQLFRVNTVGGEVVGVSNVTLRYWKAQGTAWTSNTGAILGDSARDLIAARAQCTSVTTAAFKLTTDAAVPPYFAYVTTSPASGANAIAVYTQRFLAAAGMVALMATSPSYYPVLEVINLNNSYGYSSSIPPMTAPSQAPIAYPAVSIPAPAAAPSPSITASATAPFSPTSSTTASATVLPSPTSSATASGTAPPSRTSSITASATSFNTPASSPTSSTTAVPSPTSSAVPTPSTSSVAVLSASPTRTSSRSFSATQTRTTTPSPPPPTRNELLGEARTDIRLPIPGKVVAVVTSKDVQERWSAYKSAYGISATTNDLSKPALADEQAVFVLSTKDGMFGIRIVKCYLNRLYCEPASAATPFVMPQEYQAVPVAEANLAAGAVGGLFISNTTLRQSPNELFWCFGYPETQPMTAPSGTASDWPDGVALCIGAYLTGMQQGREQYTGFASLLQLGFSWDPQLNQNPNSQFGFLHDYTTPFGSATAAPGGEAPLAVAPHPRSFLPYLFVGTSAGTLYAVEAAIAPATGTTLGYGLTITKLTLSYAGMSLQMSSTGYQPCYSYFTGGTFDPSAARPITGLAVGRPMNSADPSSTVNPAEATTTNVMITINLGTMTSGPQSTWLFNGDAPIYTSSAANAAAMTIPVLCASLDSPSAPLLATQAILAGARQRYFPKPVDLYVYQTPARTSMGTAELQSIRQVLEGSAPTLGRTFRFSTPQFASSEWAGTGTMGSWALGSNTYYSVDAINHGGFGSSALTGPAAASSRLLITCNRSPVPVTTTPVSQGSIQLLRYRYRTSNDTTTTGVSNSNLGFDNFRQRRFATFGGDPAPETSSDASIHCSSAFIMDSAALRASLVPVNGLSMPADEPFAFITVSRSTTLHSYLRAVRLGSDMSDVSYRAVMPAPWPQYRHNPQRTGRVSRADAVVHYSTMNSPPGAVTIGYGAAGPNPAVSASRRFVNTTLSSAPVVASNGLMYIVVRAVGTNADMLYCLFDKTLSTVWQSTLGVGVIGSHATLDQPRQELYVGLAGPLGGINAYDAANGTVRWSLRFPSVSAPEPASVYHTPLLMEEPREAAQGVTLPAHADALYYGDSAGFVRAISRERGGFVYWNYSATTQATNGPMLPAGATVVTITSAISLSTDKASLLFTVSTNTLVRINRLTGGLMVSRAIGVTGTLPVPILSGGVLVVETGMVRVNADFLSINASPLLLTPVLTGKLFAYDVDRDWAYFSIDRGLMRAASTVSFGTAAPFYNYTTGDANSALSTVPAVGTDGTAYTVSQDGYLYALRGYVELQQYSTANPALSSSAKEQKWKVKLGNATTSSPYGASVVIGMNGAIFAAFRDTLYRLSGAPDYGAAGLIYPSPTPTASPRLPSLSTSNSPMPSVSASAVSSISSSAAASATVSTAASVQFMMTRTASVSTSPAATVTTGIASVSASPAATDNTGIASVSASPAATVNTGIASVSASPAATMNTGTVSPSVVATMNAGTVSPSVVATINAGTVLASVMATTSTGTASASISASSSASAVPTPSSSLNPQKAVDEVIERASLPPAASAPALVALPSSGSAAAGSSTISNDPLTALRGSIVILPLTAAPLPSGAALLKLSFAPVFSSATNPEPDSPGICGTSSATEGQSLSAGATALQNVLVVPEGSTRFSSITVKLGLQSVQGYLPSSSTPFNVPVAGLFSPGSKPPAWLAAVFESIALGSVTDAKAGRIFCVGRPLISQAGAITRSRLVFSAPAFQRDQLSFDAGTSSIVAPFAMNVTATLQLNASSATPWADAELVDCAGTLSTLVAVDNNAAMSVVRAFESTAAAASSLASAPSTSSSGPYHTKHLLAYGMTAWVWNALWAVPTSWYRAAIVPSASSLKAGTDHALVASKLLSGTAVAEGDYPPSLAELCPLASDSLASTVGVVPESCFSNDERIWRPLQSMSGSTASFSQLMRLESLEIPMSSDLTPSSVILTDETLLYAVGTDMGPSVPAPLLGSSFSSATVSPAMLPSSPFAAFALSTASLSLNSTAGLNGRFMAVLTPSLDDICPVSASDSQNVRAFSVGTKLVKSGKPCPRPRLMLGYADAGLLRTANGTSSVGLVAAKRLCSSPVADAYNVASTRKSFVTAAIAATAGSAAFAAAEDAVVSRMKRPMTMSCPPVCTQASLDAYLKAWPEARPQGRRNLLVNTDGTTTDEGSSESSQHTVFAALSELLASSASTYNGTAFVPNPAVSSSSSSISSSSELSSSSATRGGFSFLRLCSPSAVTHPEAAALALAISDAQRLGICANASDYRSAGSFGLCFWGENGDCQTCPSGAVCRGGYSLRPRDGFFVSSEEQLDYPIACPFPALERCTGWDASAAATACGSGYVGPRCSLCADGWYQDKDTGGRCMKCPASDQRSAFMAILSSVGIVLATCAGLGLLVLVPSVILTKRNGGTAYGALVLTFAFLFSAYEALQAVVQVANTAPPDVPASLAVVFASLRKLQYQGVGTVPLACTSTPPLLSEMIVMSIALACALLWFIAFAVWSLRLWRQPIPGPAKPTPEAATCGLRCARVLEQAGNVGLVVGSFIFALATNAVFTVLLGYTQVTVTLVDYQYLLVDGTTAAEALASYLPSPPAGMTAKAMVMDILSGQAGRYFDLATAKGEEAYRALLQAPFEVKTVSSYPSVVVGERIYTSAYPLAVLTFIVLVIGMPVVGYLLVRLVGIPMVLERTRVPKVLLAKGLPHIAYGGATTEAVLAKERGIEEGKAAASSKGASSASASRNGLRASLSSLCGCFRGGQKKSRRSATNARRGSVASSAVKAATVVDSAFSLDDDDMDALGSKSVTNPLASLAAASSPPANVKPGSSSARQHRVSRIATSSPSPSQAAATGAATATPLKAPAAVLELTDVTEAELYRELERKARQRQTRFVSRGLSAGKSSGTPFSLRGCCRGRNSQSISHGVGGGLAIAQVRLFQALCCGNSASRRPLAFLFGVGKRYTLNPLGSYEPEEALMTVGASTEASPANGTAAAATAGGATPHRSQSAKAKASSYLPSVVVPRVSVNAAADGFRTGRSRVSFMVSLSMDNPLNATVFSSASGRRKTNAPKRAGSVASSLAITEEGDEDNEGNDNDKSKAPVLEMVPFGAAGDDAKSFALASPVLKPQAQQQQLSGSKLVKSYRETSGATKSSRNILALLGKPTDDEDNVAATSFAVNLLGFPGCCTRHYDRRIQTPSDLIDSSEAIRSPPALYFFTSWMGYRASRAYAIPINWAFLVVLSAASIYNPSAAGDSAESIVSLLLARGALLFLFGTALALWQIFDSPNSIERQWMSPVVAYIDLITGVASLYSSLATARSVLLESSIGASTGVFAVGHYLTTLRGKESLDSLGFFVAILCASLVPLLIVVFLLTMVKGAKREAHTLEVKQQAVRRGTKMAAISTSPYVVSPSASGSTSGSAGVVGSPSSSSQVAPAGLFNQPSSPKAFLLPAPAGTEMVPRSRLSSESSVGGSGNAATSADESSSFSTGGLRTVSIPHNNSGGLKTAASVRNNAAVMDEARAQAGVMMVRRTQTIRKR